MHRLARHGNTMKWRRLTHTARLCHGPVCVVAAVLALVACSGDDAGAPATQAGTVEGTITWSGSEGMLEGVRLRLARHPGPPIVLMATDGQGRFQGAAPAGEWTLAAMPPLGLTLEGDSMTVRVEAGKATNLGSVAVRRAVHPVVLRNDGFLPRELTVAPGALVRWVVDADGVHRIRLQGPRADDSGPVERGGNFEAAFDVVGWFSYRCMLHDGEVGLIFVQ
jgi:plastocyanin